MDKEARGRYAKPVVERFGTFRDLTRLGPDDGADIAAVFGIVTGCNDQSSDEFGCDDRS